MIVPTSGYRSTTWARITAAHRNGMSGIAVLNPGDPFEDLSELERVVFVMKSGVVVKAP